MSNRRNNNYSTSSSSSPSSSDFTSKKNNINEEINNESDTFNRPLSLYDNLNALVASLKPPGIHESKYLENYNKNITNHNNNNNSNNSNKNSSGNVSNNNYRNNSATVNNYSNNNNNSSDLLYNVNQEDFIFSDIKFNFPKIPIRSNYSDGNNDNDRDVVKIKNGAKKMTSNSNNHHHHNHQQHHNSNNNNNNNNNNNIQYVNLDATIGSKPVHSDAKSSFFGLNNGIHTNDRNSYNDKTKPTTSPSQQILHSTIPNGHDSNNIDNDDADDDGDDDNTLITITNVQSTTINIQKRKNRNSNEEDDGGCGVAGADDDDDDNNNNNNGGDSNDCDEEKNFIDSSESQQKQVTYITPEKYGYDNKPSQAVYMATTVPQNIKGNNIMGRHTPTRNSLRHSRMLVVNKHFQGGFEKSNPMNLQCPGLLRLLLIIALLSGILLTSLALWIKIWAPNTRFQDNPYWSGIVLIICSIISLKLLNFKRAARNNFRKICFKVLKINSIIFSVAAVILSLIAFVFAFIHFKNLWHVDDHCIPSKLFTETSECLCIFGVAADYTDHRKFKNPENIKLPSGGYTFHYKDLSCREVRDAWRYIVLASLIINLIGFLAIVFYLFIFFFKAKKRKHQTNITVNRMSSLNIT